MDADRPHDVEPQEEPAEPGLLVRIGDELVNLSAEEIVEILDWIEPVPLPGAPANVSGVVNHRGSPVTVVNLAAVLGQVSEEHSRNRRLVVLRWRGERIAITVNDVVALGRDAVARGSHRRLDLESLFQSIF